MKSLFQPCGSLASFIAIWFVALSHLPQESHGQGQAVRVTVPTLGTIEGSTMSTVGVLRKRSYYSFNGIPYAHPESYTGEANRFKPSQLWTGSLTPTQNGLYMAKDQLVRCPQPDVLKNQSITNLGQVLKLWQKRFQTRPVMGGQEDCLVVNVNTPALPRNPDDPSQLKPVLVFIHGGSWEGLWGAIFGGERFLTKDIVYVTLNYRLGLWGSFNLGIDGAPGNAATYDILNALKWVKQHIRHFGGNPDRVIVSGQSAGAMYASHLLTTPLIIDEEDGKPLIHGLITMSGSSLSQIGTCMDPLTHHLQVAAFAGCHNISVVDPNLDEVRNCMAAKTAGQLQAAMGQYSLTQIVRGRSAFCPSAPSIQDPTRFSPATPRLMVESPRQVMERSGQLDIPIMMGTTRHDGGYLLQQACDFYLGPLNLAQNSLFMQNDYVRIFLDGLNLDDPTGELYHSLAVSFIGEALYSPDFKPKIPGLLDISSVLYFKAGTFKFVEMHGKMNPASYYFSFEHKGMVTLDGGTVVPGGVGHLDSLIYLFNTFPLYSPVDMAVANRFITYWTNFVLYSNPNGNPVTGSGLPPRNTAAAYSPRNEPYLVVKGVFDYTSYRVRDGWRFNSLELMGKPMPFFNSNSTEGRPVNLNLYPTL